jgi:hypothetical protein
MARISLIALLTTILACNCDPAGPLDDLRDGGATSDEMN